MPPSTLWRVFVVTGILASTPAVSGGQTPFPAPAPASGAMGSADSARGQAIFDAQCARCHGIGARGGFGPSLAQALLPRASDDSALRAVITDGLPGTSMPGAWTLSESEVGLVASYVRSLGRIPPEPLTGDPARGEALYAGKGNCGSCHILDGAGAGWAPDLSGIGGRRGPTYLRESLLDPGLAQPLSLLPASPGGYPAYLPVEAVTRSGRKIRGHRINEDQFNIQIRDTGNRLVSLRKSELRTLRKLTGASPMPSYRGTLTGAEVEDLVAFLANRRTQP